MIGSGTVPTGFATEPHPTPDAGNDPLMSTAELAAYLSCSTTFARNLIDGGVLPSVKIDGIRRVRRSDINRLVSERLETRSRARGRSAAGSGS